MTDLRVLAMLADALGTDLGIRRTKEARRELDELGTWDGERAAAPAEEWLQPDRASGLVLASWRLLIDGSAANDGAPALLATAKKPVARLGEATASELGLADGDLVTVGAGNGELTLPLVVEPTMVDGVVWVPGNIDGAGLGELAVTATQPVQVSGGVA